MSRSLARCLVSVALVLAVIVSSRRAEAKPATLGETTAGELAAQSRPTAKAESRAKAKAKPHPKAAPVAKHTSAKAKASARAKPPASAKPKPDQKVKANAKTKTKTKTVPVRPSTAPAKPAGKPPLARA